MIEILRRVATQNDTHKNVILSISERSENLRLFMTA